MNLSPIPFFSPACQPVWALTYCRNPPPREWRQIWYFWVRKSLNEKLVQTECGGSPTHRGSWRAASQQHSMTLPTCPWGGGSYRSYLFGNLGYGTCLRSHRASTANKEWIWVVPWFYLGYSTLHEDEQRDVPVCETPMPFSALRWDNMEVLFLGEPEEALNFWRRFLSSEITIPMQ